MSGFERKHRGRERSEKRNLFFPQRERERLNQEREIFWIGLLCVYLAQFFWALILFNLGPIAPAM